MMVSVMLEGEWNLGERIFKALGRVFIIRNEESQGSCAHFLHLERASSACEKASEVQMIEARRPRRLCYLIERVSIDRSQATTWTYRSDLYADCFLRFFEQSPPLSNTVC